MRILKYQETTVLVETTAAETVEIDMCYTRNGKTAPVNNPCIASERPHRT
jgi:hypothetical protein